MIGLSRPGKGWEILIGLSRPGKGWEILISLSRPGKGWEVSWGRKKKGTPYTATIFNADLFTNNIGAKSQRCGSVRMCTARAAASDVVTHSRKS